MSKIILVTGATAGFGRAVAIKFAGNGYDVIITGRRKERLNELEAELKKNNVRVLKLNFDVRERKAADSALTNLPESWKKIDILVNNAGLASGLSHIDEADVEDWEKMIDTNIKGLLYVTRNISPLMAARNSGHIINISSIAGRDVYENGNVYCASKAAVDALSKGMRMDLLKHGIKVTNICPGMAETEFSIVRFHGDEDKAKSVYKGMESLKPEDIADIVYYCATLPQHVCINDLSVTPTQQATATMSHRKT